jgi:heme exporter protein D
MRIKDEATGQVYDDGQPPPQNGQREQPTNVTSLFDAPNFTDLVKPAQTAQAREYATKVRSGLKSVMFGAINAGDYSDAATILAYGPGFADAAGRLADESEYARKALDIITAPDSAWLAFAMTGVPLIAQVFRNHEQAIKELPNARRKARLQRRAAKDAQATQKPRFTIRVMGRQWPIYFRTPKLGKMLSGFTAQTKDPDALTYAVFSDPKVQRALAKQGIILRQETPK